MWLWPQSRQHRLTVTISLDQQSPKTYLGTFCGLALPPATRGERLREGTGLTGPHDASFKIAITLAMSSGNGASNVIGWPDCG